MKKELPHLYHGKIKEGASHNRNVSYGLKDALSVRETINKLFHENVIYKEDVEIETANDQITTKIIGRTQDHIVTINNTVIRIDDIKRIKVLK